MQYNSTLFLFCFLPVFLAIYYIVPAKWRNIPLLLGSLFFYWMNVRSSPWMLIPLLCMVLLAYGAGILMEKMKNRWVILPVGVIMLMSLIFFKIYAGGKYLPVGMSFYLFQTGAYLLSIYHGKLTAEFNLLHFSTQILMFPKLLSGPIMAAPQLQQQVRERSFSSGEFHLGLQELIIGLAMKVLIANRLGGLWAQAGVAGYGNISTGFAWLALVGYAMRLYFDFYGYSLMAVGVGRMLGFRLPDNFDDPYASCSVSEFYRRWHITLGAWFREFIYIPMGGNRVGLGRTIVNLLVVWAITGLWHGMGGNYLLWALIIVVFVILERLFLGKWLKKSQVLSRIYTIFVILLSWIPFAIGGWADMAAFFGRLFGFGESVNPMDYVHHLRTYGWILAAGVVLATPLPKKLWNKIREFWPVDIVLFILFWICVYFVATAAQDPFLYFQY